MKKRELLSLFNYEREFIDYRQLEKWVCYQKNISEEFAKELRKIWIEIPKIRNEGRCNVRLRRPELLKKEIELLLRYYRKEISIDELNQYVDDSHNNSFQFMDEVEHIKSDIRYEKENKRREEYSKSIPLYDELKLKFELEIDVVSFVMYTTRNMKNLSDSIRYIYLDDKYTLMNDVYYDGFLKWHIKDVIKGNKITYLESIKEEFVEEYYEVILDNGESHTIEFQP